MYPRTTFFRSPSISALILPLLLGVVAGLAACGGSTSLTAGGSGGAGGMPRGTGGMTNAGGAAGMGGATTATGGTNAGGKMGTNTGGTAGTTGTGGAGDKSGPGGSGGLMNMGGRGGLGAAAGGTGGMVNAGGKDGSGISSGGAGGRLTGSGGMMATGGNGAGGIATGGSGGGSSFQCPTGMGGTGNTCSAGQTFCHIRLMRASSATSACDSFVDSSRGPDVDCSANPTCACLCTDDLFFYCQTDCSCSESGGHVTVTCNQN